jgi:hypothetical protein
MLKKTLMMGKSKIIVISKVKYTGWAGDELCLDQKET